ncbi:zeaxanthin epoxidase [Aspergillus nomiae NRRL 13137]|uniref:Zeaxanthin epoxidase n=1 Tax=Aspergillus nomiae NRRL (strain ATCC 15546 / NRRL 13137 / CBS 260.88 / M93) TaxID=1509407 RepID=A0A0L1JGR0_ASPN3|nr:zeaxanthin epoxidase [Aspergillus nomiae NRRL 13137]KNG90583.1 zeaxanthin epoxidase [Aspergillus nomiae NRRL 13137]
MSPFKIIIVGGGIAGLAAAIALRDDERDITVLEQSSISQEIGALISLQPNASKIVEDQWGLGSRLREQGSMIDEAFEIYNIKGELQSQILLSAVSSKYGADRVCYHRADLHQALRERATSPDYPGRPVELRLSSRVLDCDCENGTLRKAVLGEDMEARPTGLSAYRMMIPTDELVKETDFMQVIDPRKCRTAMVIGQDRRLVMGPARNGSVYGVVALVPDERMNESSKDTSWTTKGDRGKMLDTFSNFPTWAQRPLLSAKEVGLWQLRDLDPLSTWCRGRVLLIGDAAHAMLPTQGQGAGQAVEDAEALGAFYKDFEKRHPDRSLSDVRKTNEDIFNCRYERLPRYKCIVAKQRSRVQIRPKTE